MGTIVSPVNGSDIYKGAIVPISYRSDTVDFDCATLSKICLINYLLDGVQVSGLVNISQTGVAPQTQSDETIAFPSTGATATVDIDARGIGGQQNDTATATYNLIDAPTATCDPATLVTANAAQLNATIAGTLIPGGSARFVWGAGVPNTNAATLYATGAVSAALAGLTANTTYSYRVEILDEFGNIVATSGNCQFTTSAATVNTTVNAQLVKLCTITGVTLLRDCVTSDPIFLVSVSAADGDVIPVNSTEFPAATGAGIFSTIGFYRSYYADYAGTYINPQPTTVCLPSSPDEDITVDSTIERLIGVGTITIAAGARSVDVIVKAGSPTVQIGAGAAVTLEQNFAHVWSADGKKETLSDSFVFTGVAGSDFWVSTTRS